MNYLAFEKAFREFPVFSIRDIEKQFPGFDHRRLFEWKQKGYILGIRRGYYCFSDRKKDESFLYFAANKIYSPSYVSMETGLSYYNLIPESVFTTTCVTTRNTANYETLIGNFSYRNLKESLFFGYRLIRVRDFTFKFAEVEKVILDYLYLNPVNSLEEMEGFRFNGAMAKETMDFENLSMYQKLFDSKVLDKRIGLFKELIHA